MPYFYLISVFLHTILYFIKKRFIVTNFTLLRLFRNPAISNFFPFPLGLRNSGVQLYYPVASLHSKRFQSSHCGKVREGAKKKKVERGGGGERRRRLPASTRFWKTPLDISRPRFICKLTARHSLFLLSSRRSRRTCVETLATQATR